MKHIIFFLPVLFLSSCLIQIKNRSLDDGYLKADKSKFHTYDQAIAARNTDTFSLVEINAEQLKEKMASSENAAVIVWATWCGHCILDMAFWIKEADTKDIFFVCPDYDIKGITKMFAKGHYSKPVYIIRSSQYGTDEDTKTRAFQEELIGKRIDGPIVFPSYFYFKKGEFAGNIQGPLVRGTLDAVFANGTSVQR